MEAVSLLKGEDMKKNRRNHSPAFKAKVALEAAKEERTITELSRHYGVHANQISAWKRQLLENVEEVFTSGSDKRRDEEAVIQELHAKIGELTMERDFLSGKLKR